MRRKIMTKTQQANYPYFGMGSNNAVVSLYVIHPELLAMDDVSKRGRPFLFYVGSHFQDKSGREIEIGMGSNNAVVSLYVIHPELLAMDDVSKRGRPFLFYVGSHFQDKSGREI